MAVQHGHGKGPIPPQFKFPVPRRRCGVPQSDFHPSANVNMQFFPTIFAAALSGGAKKHRANMTTAKASSSWTNKAEKSFPPKKADLLTHPAPPENSFPRAAGRVALPPLASPAGGSQGRPRVLPGPPRQGGPTSTPTYPKSKSLASLGASPDRYNRGCPPVLSHPRTHHEDCRSLPTRLRPRGRRRSCRFLRSPSGRE